MGGFSECDLPRVNTPTRIGTIVNGVAALDGVASMVTSVAYSSIRCVHNRK